MKKNHIITAVILMLLSFPAGAQVLKGSYFLDHSVNAHQMNPAFTPRANYLQLPVISNLGFGLYTDMDITKFMYPVGDKLGTYLHPEVSMDRFIRTFPKHPHLDVDFSTNLLSFGFFTKKLAFWSFGVNMRAMVDVDLPHDLFLFTKKGVGTDGESYNIGNINAYASAAVQAYLGYSRDIVKGLRVGIKARVVAPVAYAGLNIENLRLDTGLDKWSIQTEGYLHTAVKGLDLSIPQDATLPSPSFDLNRCLNERVLAGLGYSFDLGFEYKLSVGSIFDGIAVSFAVTDLGQIFYDANAVSSFSTAGKAEWTGFQNVTVTDEIAFEESLNEFLGSLEGLANLKEVESVGKFTRSTMPRIYAGLEIPFLWRTMSVGLLYSSRFSHSYARQELTASYNLKPCKWFALGLNYSFLNTTRSVGAMLELTPKGGPTFYIGCDYFPYEIANAPLLEGVLGEFPLAGFPGLNIDSWVLPTSLRLNLNLGIALNLGSKYANPKKVKKGKKDSKKK